MKKIWIDIKNHPIIIIGVILYIVLFLYALKELNCTTPVERIKIEELLITRDSLINEINQLDSIKNEKIIEIYNLDNDSTVKLFYKLVSNK